MSSDLGIHRRWTKTLGAGLIGGLAVTGASVLAVGSASAATILSGKLWIVAVGTPATFPPPSATPDATFVTNHVAFIGDGPDPTNTKLRIRYTISSYLASVQPVANLRFSGHVNPVIHRVVTSTTPLSDGVADGGPQGTYETFIELTGRVSLTNGEEVVVTHDDGVSLKVDGTEISGFTSGPTEPVSERFTLTGTTGLHTIDLVYVEEDGGPAELIFSPVP
jgi:hypothetical protein